MSTTRLYNSEPHTSTYPLSDDLLLLVRVNSRYSGETCPRDDCEKTVHCADTSGGGKVTLVHDEDSMDGIRSFCDFVPETSDFDWPE